MFLRRWTLLFTRRMTKSKNLNLKEFESFCAQSDITKWSLGRTTEAGSCGEGASSASLNIVVNRGTNA